MSTRAGPWKQQAGNDRWTFASRVTSAFGHWAKSWSAALVSPTDTDETRRRTHLEIYWPRDYTVGALTERFSWSVAG